MKTYESTLRKIEQLVTQGENTFEKYDLLEELVIDVNGKEAVRKLIDDDINEIMCKQGLKYQATTNEKNALEKEVKYQLTRIKMDYDVCLMNIILYGIICPYVKKNRKIKEYAANKFNWIDEKDKRYAIRGDTMNSFNTPVLEYIRLYGDSYSNPQILEINRAGRNAGKFMVPNNNYLGWYDLILENLEYFSNILSDDAMKYISNYHRIGNFIAIPFANGEEFNRPRGTGKTKDFWDLCLNQIYLWFCSIDLKSENEIFLYNIVGKKRNVMLLKKCLLEEFGNWEQFVETNYLQDFCDEELHPIEYWEGHFNGEVMPKQIEEFQQFFYIASRCIEKRSERISRAIYAKMLDE